MYVKIHRVTTPPERDPSLGWNTHARWNTFSTKKEGPNSKGQAHTNSEARVMPNWTTETTIVSKVNTEPDKMASTHKQ